MTAMVRLVPGFVTEVATGGASVKVADPTIGLKGGIIINPLNAYDQGLYSGSAESLFINLLGDAQPNLSLPGTVELIPGQWFLVPPNSSVWVSAATSGHKFTAFFSSTFKVQYPPEVVPGQPTGPITGGSNEVAIAAEPGSVPFPPPDVTGLTGVIPSYLYQQYTDDDDLQGFVWAQNTKQQDFVDTFNALNLPIYTGPIVSDKLLDWVARGLYGMSRPALGSGYFNLFGPLNTWGCNWIAPMWFQYDASMEVEFGLNEIGLYGPFTVYITDDDTFRRILTWHFFKADYNYCSLRFMKRRIWRFLYCNDGKSTDYAWDPILGVEHPSHFADADDAFIADTQQISLLFGPNRNCTIRFVLNDRTVNLPAGGAMCNGFGPNGFEPAWGISPPWDIGVDPAPSSGGANWQLELIDGFGNSSGTPTLVVNNVTGGSIVLNSPVYGPGVPVGTYLISQISGTPGGAGSYETNVATTLSAAPLKFETGKYVKIGGGGALKAPGGIYLNHLETSYKKLPPLPFMYIFKQALDLGVLEVPYQFNFTCTIG